MTEQDEEKLAKLLTENPSLTCSELARETGLSRSAVDRWKQRIKRKAMTDNMPEGYIIKGKSTCRNAEGDIILEWTKTDLEKEKTLELVQMAVDDMVDQCKGKSEFVKPPKNTNSDLMAVYPIADVHLGLYTWDEEVGTSWDTGKCEKVLLECMTYLVEAAPPAEHCLIPNLADFFHTDNDQNQTARSGHTLDVDTRRAKVFLTGVRAYRKMIQLALSKHKNVVVKSAIGNHDDHSILHLAVTMQAYFENNPRVTIELPINPFGYHEFGKNLIGIHHGNLKADRYPLIMAADQSAAWGRTTRRVFMTGHIHNKTVVEHPGCMVESFRSPAAKDSWTHASGYRAERDMQLIVLHRERGEISRTRIGVDNL